MKAKNKKGKFVKLDNRDISLLKSAPCCIEDDEGFEEGCDIKYSVKKLCDHGFATVKKKNLHPNRTYYFSPRILGDFIELTKHGKKVVEELNRLDRIEECEYQIEELEGELFELESKKNKYIKK